MNVDFSSKPSYTNFRAVKIADTKTVIGRINTNITLYKLGREDRPFLQKLAEKIDFKNLYPNFSQELQKRLQKLLNYCITCAFDFYNTTYMAVNNNKICGIMTYYSQGSGMNLDGICAIPPTPAKKVPFTGQTLIFQLFKDAINSDTGEITLKAINDGPVNVVEKYKKLGFKTLREADDEYTPMVCRKHKIKEQLKELPFLIDYESCSPEKTNLEKFLD